MRWMLALEFIISIAISQEEFPRQFTIKHMPIHSCLIPTLAMIGKCKLTDARVLFVFDLFCSLPRMFKFRVLCGGMGVGVGSYSKSVYLIIIRALS